MKYPSGEKIRLGDVLKVWEGCTGIVVCSIEEGKYTEEYNEKDWSYLQKGILITTDAGGLIHYPEPENNFELIQRLIES